MFNLFKKRNTKIVINAVSDGQLESITAVKDDVFSTKMLGDGYAIVPSEGNIYSPIDGVVSTIFPTKHAIGIKDRHGIELLLHLGIDTVELKGLPFSSRVQKGENVKAGQLLSVMDISLIKSRNYDDTIIVVYTNMDIIESVSAVKSKNVHHLDPVQTLILKS